MCGITGWFSPRPANGSDKPRLHSMMARLSHRGPDGQGLLLTSHAALGHTRLAIIDLAGGAQPMSSDDGKLHITFNGEIYNFRAIRQKLARRGTEFRTHSDTEVILKLYEHGGWEAFGQLRGMYAFAIWDERAQTGWLVRDPLGIKPLFLALNPQGELLFGSEAKAILAAQEDRPALDEDALHLLLNFRYLPGDRSLFRGIRQVAPGTALAWRPDGSTQHHRITASLDEDTGVSVLENLAESLRAHLVADVEVGAYLSGGIDSAAIVALAKRNGDSLRTFTLEIGDDPQEATNAARTAQLLNVPNVVEPPQDNLRDVLPRMVWHLELPKVNGLQVQQIARLAAKHVKVALSGLGGDELFLGYNAHRLLHLAGKTDAILPRWASGAIGALVARGARHFGRPLWSEAERAGLMLDALGDWHRVYGLLRNVWDHPKLRRQIYGPRMLDITLPNAFDVLKSSWPDEGDPVAAMAQFEWKEKMVNDLLWQEDRLSMAEGLEVRVPFVDVALKQRVTLLSRAVLMPGGRPKGYLREALAPLLPQEILKRPKSGFQVDAPVFFRRYLAPLAEEILSEAAVREAGLFNPAFVRTVRAYGPHERFRWHYFMLYLMLGTHLWLEVFKNR